MLRLLILEDSAVDAELEVTALEEAGYVCRWTRVQTRAEFLAHLQAPQYDVIFADYSLPNFDGLSALEIVRERGLDIPFVLISGTIGEERAIASLRAGATDYVMKTQLTRLVSVVERAREEWEGRRQRRRAEEDIGRLNTELERRVAERTAQLEVANKELEAFSYSVSHDLRAPLRAIDGFSKALLEDYAGALDPQGQRYLRRVREAAERMGQLIEDLLSLSRVTRAEMHRCEAVDLSALAHAIAAELQKTKPERQVEFVIAPGLVARGDARLLRVALENLLGNAWKYTSKHPTARIEFGRSFDLGEDEKSQIENQKSKIFFVRDDGAGFDMAYVDKLFGAFQRLHSVSDFEGTGIGLATVQRIIHRHGGRIWAEGVVGRGATFCFTL